MTSNEAVDAVAAWVRATLPELTGAYNHVPALKTLALPDVVVEVQRSGVRREGGELFAAWNIQQALIYVTEVELSFMVDNTDTEVAADQLRDFERRIILSVLADPSLGARVPFASPLVEFDFTGPYVEYEDGTKGREMRMTLAVGDLVEAMN